MTGIKIVLILAVVGVLALLVRQHGSSRASAYAKIGLGLFLAFTVYAVIRPDDVSWVAAHLGVGRGADLVLYLLVVGFGYFAISTYLRFKELEMRFARLARALALLDTSIREGRQQGLGHRSEPADDPVGPDAERTEFAGREDA